MRLPLTAARTLALCAALTGAGCASTPGDEDPAAPPVVQRPDVGASHLARELGLVTVASAEGRVALEAADGSRILLFPGTRVATVAGAALDLAQTISPPGGEVWLGAADADRIRSTWRTRVVAYAPGPSSSSSGAYLVPIPAAPGPSASAPPPPAPAAPPVASSDNKPTATEIAQWSVPLRRKWLYLVVHHSASAAGNAAQIDSWHRDRGFDGLGYDFVIGNGTGSWDGAIEVGYRWKQQLVGAHAKTAGNFMNEHGIGICLVGDFTRTRPTPAQMRSLDRLCTFLAQYCGIPPQNLRMHGEVKSTECPGKYFPREFEVRLPGPATRTAAGSGRR